MTNYNQVFVVNYWTKRKLEEFLKTNKRRYRENKQITSSLLDEHKCKRGFLRYSNESWKWSVSAVYLEFVLLQYIKVMFVIYKMMNYLIW